jgi:tetratricopeptide (TPR) repeat protein
VAPEVSAWLKDRRVKAAGKVSADHAAHAVLDGVSSPAVVPSAGQARGGAAWLLRPDQRVVGFVDRPELARLREWCAEEGAPGVMLLTGAGGVGKTRLALGLAEEQQKAGWLCRMVRIGGEARVVAAARAVSRGGVLLIVDYAETRPGLVELLQAVAGDGGDRLRVVLLARSVGEWWAQLEASTDPDVRLLVAAAGPVPVGVLGEAASGADLVRAAVPQFARAMGAAVPGSLQVAVPEGPVPMLVLHATALLAVLEARERPPAAPVRMVADEQVLAGLLAREKVFWLGSARAADLAGPDGVDSVTAAQAVAVACLITVADESGAAQALRRVPGLAHAPLGQVHKIARWLRQLYPADRAGPAGAEARWWGYLQPDLLAERHVVGELADASDLARACLRDLAAEQAHGALTVLARACVHRPQAPGLIAAALRADLSGLGVHAIAVAVQTGGRLGGILADVVSDAAAPLETLIQIEEAIPYPTVVLAEADAVLAERISRMLPEDTERGEIARWRDLLGVRLSQAGRPHQALPVTQEAIAIRRQLAALSPDRYRPDLAASLTNLGIWLSELGRPADALPVTQEAVAIRRQLAALSPDRYRPDLAASLSNLGVWFSELGRPADALPVTQEAVAIRRELAALSPDRYRSDLAASLTNLGIWLSELGRPADALPVTQEAVTTYRELATLSPDRYRPDLAASLSNLGIRLSALGRDAEATAAHAEAKAIHGES